MPTPMQQLREIEKQLFAYHYALTAISYDDATVAPPESSEGRGEAMAVLSAAQHRLMTESGLPELLAAARAEPLTEQEEVVYADNLIAVTQQTLTEVGADKAGSTRHQDTFTFYLQFIHYQHYLPIFTKTYHNST